MSFTFSLQSKAQKVKLIVLDVDGVLTDGRIIYDTFGDELKCFDVRDGLAVALARRAGLRCVLLTARRSKVVQLRAREMAVDALYCQRDKQKTFEKILRRFKVAAEEVCYMGDDLLDLAPLTRAGLAVSVPNGADDVRARAHYVTEHAGGHGAVRETIEQILKAQGAWEEVVAHYGG